MCVVDDMVSDIPVSEGIMAISGAVQIVFNFTR